MAWTSEGLIANCEKALAAKTLYMWGTYGSTITKTLVAGKKKQYPARYSEDRVKYLLKHVDTYQACDCGGLIKNYYFGGWDNVRYQSKWDKNVSGWRNACTSVGKISNLPEVKGLALFMEGHVGVYAGNGYAYEATLGKYGDGVVKTKVNGRGWTHYGYLPEMEYPEEDKAEETPVEFKVGDVVKVVGAYYYNGTTKIPSWVKKDTWIISSIKGDRIVLGDNLKHTNNINSPVKAEAIEKAEVFTTMTVSPSVGLWYHSDFPCGRATRIAVWKQGTKVSVLNGWEKKSGGYTWCKVKHGGKIVYTAKDYLK